MKKRILSAVTAIMMVVSTFPAFVTTAFADAPMIISNASDLIAFRDAVNSGNNYSGMTVYLENDINLGGSESNQWIPIGNADTVFAGIFEGQGHTISGLYINSTSDNQGLFGNLYMYDRTNSEGKSGTIKNLNVSGYVAGVESVGGITGKSGTLENCSSSCTVVGVGTDSFAVGGVSGGSTMLYNCYNTGTVSGYDAVGGVMGFLPGRTATDCYNTGKVSGRRGVGGIVGDGYDGGVVRCYNTGDISGTETIGGIIGNSRIAGYTIQNVTDCYNTGSVSGTSQIGGLAGCNYGAKVITGYNIGKVTGSTKVGAISGESNNTQYTTAITSNCYYLNGSGSGISGASGCTAEQLANQNTFSGWDFTNTWKMNAALGRPVLRAIAEAAPSSSAESGTINTPYSGNISTAMNVNAANNTFECIGGFRPAGLDFDGEAFMQNGIVAGTPTASGNYAMFVRATDESGNSNVDLIHIYIAPIFDAE